MRAIQESSSELAKVSSERIFAEIKRLLESRYLGKGLDALLTSKLDSVFWPELNGLNVERLRAFPKFLNWENAFAAIMYLQGPVEPMRVSAPGNLRTDRSAECNCNLKL